MAAKRIPMGHKRRGETHRAYDPRGAAARRAAYSRRIAGARRNAAGIAAGRAQLQTTASPFFQAVNAAGMTARSWGQL